MKSDLLGHISILHLRIADSLDPGCQSCLELAELASQAVDFPKTGAAVHIKSLPRLDEKRKPDFLCPDGSGMNPKKYYLSKKILGRLFRNVPQDNRRPPEDSREFSPIDGHKVSQALRSIRLQDLGLPPLQDSSDNLRDEMKFILYQYKEQLLVIARTHTLSRGQNYHLTEAELVTGTIEATWGDHRRRQAAASAMNFQASLQYMHVCQTLKVKVIDARARVRSPPRAREDAPRSFGLGW